jgi:hypothetical protein
MLREPLLTKVKTASLGLGKVPSVALGKKTRENRDLSCFFGEYGDMIPIHRQECSFAAIGMLSLHLSRGLARLWKWRAKVRFIKVPGEMGRIPQHH